MVGTHDTRFCCIVLEELDPLTWSPGPSALVSAPSFTPRSPTRAPFLGAGIRPAPGGDWRCSSGSLRFAPTKSRPNRGAPARARGVPNTLCLHRTLRLSFQPLSCEGCKCPSELRLARPCGLCWAATWKLSVVLGGTLHVAAKKAALCSGLGRNVSPSRCPLSSVLPQPWSAPVTVGLFQSFVGVRVYHWAVSLCLQERS